MLVAGIGWTQIAAFEVASIKSDPGCTARPRTAQILSPGRLNMECITLRDLVEYAYAVWANAANPNPKRSYVRGGPGWVNSDHYTMDPSRSAVQPKRASRVGSCSCLRNGSGNWTCEAETRTRWALRSIRSNTAAAGSRTGRAATHRLRSSDSLTKRAEYSLRRVRCKHRGFRRRSAVSPIESRGDRQDW
jgi:hypothetical protein